MSHAIQHLVMPNMAFGAPEEMYVRLSNDRVHALMSEGRLLFDAGGRASFDTFFNSVTVQAWKDNTAVADLQLHLRGTGQFIVRLGLHRIGHAQRWLQEQVVTLNPESDLILDVQSWAKLESGMLYFALEALEPGSLTEGRFATCTAPQREVKLGIVITHFNRKQWVLPAIARIRNELLSDPSYNERIELVVDNSQNITAEESHGITLIPNNNLGGSGGFTRGLLHLKDQKSFTHCLFMDDDASCEIESIRRSIALIGYSKNSKKSSVAGALLREVEPWRLIDKGSNFNGAPYCERGGLDIRQIDDLLKSEQYSELPEFGGWWYLMFPIQEVRHYSYPFFVKCDDVLFGITNPFPIVTLNGISCWSDDFALKEGPLPRYLDTRSRIVMNFITGNHGLIDSAKWAAKFIVAPLLSHNYISARAAITGLQHVLKGPAFFRDNLDTTEIRKIISDYGLAEKMTKVNRHNLVKEHRGASESKIRKLVRVASLNGFLLPSFLLKNQVIYQRKGFRANLREIFRYKHVYYEHEETGLGYVAHFNRGDFFKLSLILFVELTNYVLNFRRLKSDYANTLNYLTSEEYWREVYSKRI